MSDQANDYQRRINGLAGMANQQIGYSSVRLAKVWVAYWSTGADGEPLAVFPTKALADVYLAGAEMAAKGQIAVIEMPINYGG